MVHGGNVSRDAPGVGGKRQHPELEAEGHLCVMGWCQRRAGGSLRMKHRQVRQKGSDGCDTGDDVPTVESQSASLSFPPPRFPIKMNIVFLGSLQEIFYAWASTHTYVCTVKVMHTCTYSHADGSVGLHLALFHIMVYLELFPSQYV